MKFICSEHGVHLVLPLVLARLYHCNLSQVEQKALFDLSHDENIIIEKADISSIVIMNRSDYIQEVERQLKNEKYYEQLNEDPSENLAKDIKIMLKTFHKKREKVN